MYITLESDYAVRIVSVLCREGCRLDAKLISQDTAVPLRFALKILRSLVKADLVKSYKGSKGGYEIAKQPRQITLKDVIEAVEGTYYFSRCLSDEYQCNGAASGACRYRAAFDDISNTVRQKLDSYNFADLLGL